MLIFFTSLKVKNWDNEIVQKTYIANVTQQMIHVVRIRIS